MSLYYGRNKWMIKSDFQEIHYWDKNAGSKVGSINFYQLYLESKFKGLNFRIGRQGVLLDNGRIFSDAPWAQQGRSHEGIRMMKYSTRFRNDLFLLFTRRYGDAFDPLFSPVASHRYKYLAVYHLSYNPNKAIAFNSINAVDLFRNENAGKNFARITTGGRIEYKYRQFYATLNAYLQFGQNPRGNQLFAYYLQPEFRLSTKYATLRLGAEILSGGGPDRSANQSGDFDVLYGVAWKFMGNMNIFTRFPADVAGKGLVNPYLFVTIPIAKKLSIRSDLHLFFSQYSQLDNLGSPVKKYLGFENDFSFRYAPVKYLEINYGLSFLKSSTSMRFLPKVEDESRVSYWSYLMVSYQFKVFRREQRIP
ncbi:MAG: hypothetical protein EOO04_28410 [Chitinophagaceae bacterium]|nr:MAG: hypothetical protein EOO04_28410 [Chitinophagaceae bacterium]